jgi:hypothetical protein
MIQHVVLFKFKAGTAEADVDVMIDSIRALSKVLPFILSRSSFPRRCR